MDKGTNTHTHSIRRPVIIGVTQAWIISMIDTIWANGKGNIINDHSCSCEKPMASANRTVRERPF